MKRRWRARRKRRWKAVAAVPWRVARRSWSHEDRDEEQLVEDSRWCQYRGLAATQEKHSAARAWSTEKRPDRSRRREQGRQRSCQAGIRAEVSPEATMKHVPSPSQGVSRKFDEPHAKWT